jgi:hypothetical protein
MQKKSILLVLSIMALAVFGAQEAAHAGGAGGGQNQFIYANPTALGNGVSATVTLFFTESIDPFTGSPLASPRTIWFMKVKMPDKVADAGAPAFNAYDGLILASQEDNPALPCTTTPCCYDGIDCGSVQSKLMDSISNTTFLSDLITCKNPQRSPTMELKSYSNFIQSGDGWTTMDVVLALKCLAAAPAD